ncbi:hypothetical protein LRP30_07600 [Bradyrhizobium sp. C-145]|uniref:hypothetical protein n=1 Tax=Bradyrhizobium sp. C-145 TaxID=574727 RepID=UPI00201B5DAD|nr:hypothetical protein [Bradyrhizobium sp. C-145]UQR65105.1 hypothetical protein LRP30_07600 [Bradyrhizobium sp. C-145]
MIKTRLKYCVFDPDRRGNPRYYVRKPGHKKIRIHQAFEDETGHVTAEFMKAYFEALEGLERTGSGKVSHFPGPHRTVRQIGEKRLITQSANSALVGPAGLEPATRPL